MSKYVVVDVEMCHSTRARKNRKSPLKTEMIQIGAVLLDESFEIKDKYISYIAPEYNCIDSYIENLTGIKPQDVEHARDTKTVLEEFTAWLPEDTVFVEWSRTDEKQIRNEMIIKNIHLPKLEKILDTFLDCQELFSEKLNTDKVYRLSEALSIAGIESKEGSHDGFVDAYNTALLFAKMNREDVLELSPYYCTESEVEHLSFNPFAELLKNYTPAV